MQGLKIIIIGAGLGGLTAAVGLSRAGHDVNVYEQAPELGEIGAGIMLTPNAVRALEYIGALDDVEALAVEPELSYSRHYLTGEILGERPVASAYRAEYGRPMYNIHRADLHRALASVAAGAGVRIHLGHRFLSLEQGDQKVEAAFENGVTAAADLLVGADGIRSAVRKAAFGESPPKFTGMVAWRGLVPLDTLPEHLRGTSMTSWVSSDRHIIEYAVGDLKNYVALALEPDWTSESWATPSTVAEVREMFPGWHADIATIIDATPEGGSFKYALHDHDPLPVWSSNRVVLMGDAAHAMLPLMAQGAAMSMEDGVALCRAVDVSASLGEMAARYEALRVPRASWTQVKSREARKYYHSADKGVWQKATGERNEILYTYDIASAPI